MLVVMDIDTKLQPQTRIQRLKASTDGTHRQLDQRIMGADPFASRERYGLFLRVQHQFHADVAPLYRSTDLNRMLPGLGERCRLEALRQDLADITGNEADSLEGQADALDLPKALGWVYVAEGSNLGAAFLLKEAEKLGLSEEFGARHLAGHPAGRGLHWRNFVASFNALPLSEAEETEAAEGARAAFRRVHGLVDDIFG
ncbi:biliverdin-producing heme oxygenase [Neorhizobium lilium]|uniref:Biliverdin-producing heme oxygenase n=1 Tax=Neorhizobium lilium TaxID=2503024 RepID=A0A3S3SUH7_9HYPH|nr:biliverdin-producing heme oxygenase [Neorhizobium lilium]RWX75105.1 biliverdin-producing heme oxygenase [Neorhizobium lilium]